MDDIRSAWLSRQKSVDTAHCEWLEVRTCAKGSLFHVENPGQRYPLEDVTVEISMSLKIMGPALFRYTRNGPTWDLSLGMFIDREYTTVYGGEASKAYYGENNEASVHRTGFVEERQSDYDNRHLLPLLINFRPLHENVDVLTNNASVSSRTARIGTTRCVVVQFPETGRISSEYWLDPTREFIVLRILKELNGNLIRQIDVSYDRDTTVGWTPVTWSIIAKPTYSDAIEHCRAKVTAYEINSGIDTNDFVYEFPEGTLVTDHIRDSVYIQRQNGKKRDVAKEELRASIPYEKLVSTDGPDATLPLVGTKAKETKYSLRFGFVVANVMVVVLLVLIVVIRSVYRIH